MLWLAAIIAIWAGEQMAHPFLDRNETWELALFAKYLSLAAALQLVMVETQSKGLMFRSLVAVFCIGAWVDSVGQLAWAAYSFDSALLISCLWSLWFIFTARRAYEYQGDHVRGSNVYLMLLRPASVFAVCKALVGFPCASVCLYANGMVWSYRAKTGTFDLYPVDARSLSRHIAIDTGVHCSDQITEMLDALVGQRRYPGTKCVWSIRHVLARLGETYKPRLFDYLPGIYAMRIIKGRR